MKNNIFSKNLKTHEILYYFNIDNDIMIRLRFKKPTSKNFGSINIFAKDNIIKIINFKDFDINGANIIHEFTHIKQKLNHELYIEKINNKYVIFWHDNAYITHSKYMKAKKDEYYTFPWEVEAYENMGLLSDFHQSTYLRELEGKNPTLDFMFDNNFF